jgi:putative hydroxymethylpyrimidine transport system substrate-binding protein
VAVGVVAVLLAGCGGGSGEETAEKSPARPQKLQKLEVTLDGFANPQTMGILMADKLGYFEEAGLDVSISKPLNPVRPINYVEQQIVDLAVSHEPQVVLAREKGAPITAVGSLVSEPTAAMIWLKKSKIDGIADLKGKTIAIPGLSFQRGLLQSLLAQAGLSLADVKVERVDYELLPALISGRADAIFGGSWNVEGIELEERGLDPVVTRVSDAGVPTYDEFVLIAHRERLARDPQSIRDFISATARGTAAAGEEDPKAIAEAILEVSEKKDQKATEAEVEATLPLLSEDGYMDPGEAEQLMDWMLEEGLIRKAPPVSGWLKAEAP